MKNILLFKLVLVFAFVLTVASCAKQDPALLSADGTILDTGMIAADGCGWQIKFTDNTQYSITNLDPNYQKNNLKVSISYHLLTTKLYCGLAPTTTGIAQIEIKSIKQK